MREISFADGFTSNTEPSSSGVSLEPYQILNNQSSLTNVPGLNFGGDLTSVFVNYELERKHTVALVEVAFRQVGSFVAVKSDSGWSLNFGSYSGDDIISDSISGPSKTVLSIDSSSGQIQYQSGEMTGDNYSGALKLSITRIQA